MNLAYSSNAYMRFDVFEAIERVAALGYRGVELMADEPHAWPPHTSDEKIARLRGAVEARGLSVSNVNAFMMNAVGDPRHVYWHPSWIETDVDLRTVRVQHTIDAIHLAKKLGAPSITTEPGGPLEEGTSREWAMNTFVEGLRRVLPHAERAGVKLLVEPEPGLLIENVEQTLDLRRRIESPAFGINVDLGHFYCVGEPLPQTVRRLAHVCGHYHVEDIAASRVHEHLVPGDGAIDFPPVLRAIHETGYRGWITVELYPYVEDPDDAGRRALNYLKPLTPG